MNREVVRLTRELTVALDELDYRQSVDVPAIHRHHYLPEGRWSHRRKCDGCGVEGWEAA
jgi:hypothetical protein